MVPAREVAVGFHHQVDVEVAGRSAVVARVALAAEADLHPVLHAGRDVDLDAPPPALSCGAAAVGARAGNDAAFAVAGGASAHLRELAEYAALNPAHLAGAVALAALGGRAAGLCAAAPALAARLDALQVDLAVHAENRLLERYGCSGLDVAAALRRAACAGAEPAEERVEYVAEAAEVLEALEAAAPAGAHVPEAVVLRPLLRIAEHLVGGVDLLEPLLRAGVLVPVGMVLQRETPELGAMSSWDALRGTPRT